MVCEVPAGPVRSVLRIDWLTLVAPVEEIGGLLRIMEEFFGPPHEESYGAFRGYRRHYAFVPGCTLNFSPVEDGGPDEFVRPECCVNLVGSVIGRLDSATAADLLLRVRGIPGLKATRLDIAYDDFDREISVADLWRCYAEPRLFGPARSRRHQEGDGNGERQGESIYFGDREGGKVVVVYDKGAESGGEIEAVR